MARLQLRSRKTISFFILALFLLLLLVHPVSMARNKDVKPGVLVVNPTASKTLFPTADTYVNAANPTTAYGDASDLHVGRYDNKNRRILVRFDVSDIPQGSTITSAYLDLHPVFNQGAGATAVTAFNVWPYRILNSWAEATTTWYVQPSVTGMEDPGTNVEASADWTRWTVTNIVRSWITNGTSNYGIALLGDGATEGIYAYYARGSSFGPKLIVTYKEPTNTPTATRSPTFTPTPSFTPTYTHTPSFTPTHTITPTRTPQPTITPTNTPRSTHTPTKTPRPTITPTDTPSPTPTPRSGVVGECPGQVWVYADRDTWVESSDPEAIHGKEDRIWLGDNASAEARTLLHFPVEGVVPPEQNIYHVALNLWAFDATSLTRDIRLNVHSLSGSFSETTTKWSNKPGSLTFYGERMVTGSGQSIDVTDAVRAWRAGTEANHGLALEPVSDDFWYQYGSREYWVQPPRLTINCGSDEITPTPTHTPSRTPTATHTPTRTPTATPSSTPSCPGTTIIQADADTYLDSRHRDWVLGNNLSLYVDRFIGGPENGYADTLVHFPKLDAMDGYYVYNATLRLRTQGPQPAEPLDQYRLYTLNGPFDENTTTFNNAPSVGDWHTDRIDMPAGDWHEMDVTEPVQAIYTEAAPNHGFRIQGNQGRVIYDSREYTNPPELAIECGLDAPTITPTPTATPTPIPWDLIAYSMNVVQAVQDTDNTVPLVQGKPTFVRFIAHAKKNDSYYTSLQKANAENMTNYRAWLTASRNGQELEGSPLYPVVIPDALNYYHEWWRDSFVFELPPDWVDGTPTELQVQIRAIAVHEPDEWKDNNTLTINIDPRPVPPMCAVFIPVRAYSLGSPPANYMYSGKGLEMLNRANSLLPTYIWPYYQSEPIENLRWCSTDWWPYLPYPCYGGYRTDSDDDGSDMLTALWWRDRWSDDPDECDDACARTHYVGMSYQKAGTNTFGKARPDWDCSWFLLREGDGPGFGGNSGPLLNNPQGGVTLAHELGHNYGIKHTDCGNPDDPGPWPYENTCWIGDASHPNIGFEPNTLTSMKWDEIADLMGYQSPKWPASKTWNHYYNDLRNQYPSPDWPFCSYGELSALSAPEDILIVSGTSARESMTATLTSSLTPSDLLPPKKLAELLEPQTGDSQLNLLDAAGQTLASYTVERVLAYEQGEGGTKASGWVFGIGVPVPEGLAAIEAVGPDGVLATKTLSVHAPEVTITSPNGGESIGDPFVIRWDASDEDDDDLTYMVQYSADAGEDWKVLVTNAFTTTYTTTVASLAGGTESLIRVIANDGVLTGFDESDAPFQVPRQAPIAFIYTADGKRFGTDPPLVLQGGGMDNEDGYLQGEALTWTVPGQVTDKPGDSLTLFNVPPGKYKAILTATDSDGVSSTASIQFTVGLSLYIPIIIR